MQKLYNFWFTNSRGFIIFLLLLVISTAIELTGHFTDNDHVSVIGLFAKSGFLFICAIITIPLVWWKESKK